VVHLRRGVDPALIVRLSDGTHAAIAMSWTNAGQPQEILTAHSETELPRLARQGLRQLGHLLEQRRQAERFPNPRRSTARAVRRTLLGGTPGAPGATREVL
jgi:hypothetical protein